MVEEGTQQVLLTTTATKATADGSAEFSNVVRDVVGQVPVLGAGPYLFSGIKFWCIRGQPFEIKAAGKPSNQSAGPRTMHRPAVHNQNNTASKLCQNSIDKLLKILGGDVVFVAIEIQSQPPTLWRNGDCRDDRNSVVSVPAIMNGRARLWGPGASNHRLQHKAAFIRENDATTLSSGFFLYGANLSFATGRLLSRRVRGPDVRVSGSSSPWPLERAIRLTDRSEHQNVCGSLPPLASGSTVRWHIRACEPLSAATGPASDVVWLRAWEFCLVAALHKGPCLHELGISDATGSLLPGLPRLSELFRVRRGLAPAKQQPGVDAVPTLLLYLLVSCIMLSTRNRLFI
jgi:hypothetical protein